MFQYLLLLIPLSTASSSSVCTSLSVQFYCSWNAPLPTSVSAVFSSSSTEPAAGSKTFGNPGVGRVSGMEQTASYLHASWNWTAFKDLKSQQGDVIPLVLLVHWTAVYLESSTSLQWNPGFSDTEFKCLVCTDYAAKPEKWSVVLFVFQQVNVTIHISPTNSEQKQSSQSMF